MNELVRLKKRPARKGPGFYYFLEFTDLDGRRKRISLGHANKRKAERQRTEKEQDLRTGYVQPKAMRLSRFTSMASGSQAIRAGLLLVLATA